MHDPTPRLLPAAPFEVTSARTLFATGTRVRRHFAGLCALPDDRLLLTFMFGSMPRRNDGGVMLAISQDRGATWEDPKPLYAVPGWDCFPNGGICMLREDHIRLYAGQYRFAPELGGDQPFSSDWITRSADSFDRGTDLVGTDRKYHDLSELDRVLWRE